MSPRSARHAVLSEIAPFEGSDLRVVIETPRGSRSKYSYDPDCDCMQLSTVLPEGMVFPYDFGFIPSTIGEDGDPLDVLVLMEASVVPGCVVRARLVGAFPRSSRWFWALPCCCLWPCWASPWRWFPRSSRWFCTLP
jgi:hypothetical protein